MFLEETKVLLSECPDVEYVRYAMLEDYMPEERNPWGVQENLIFARKAFAELTSWKEDYKTKTEAITAVDRAICAVIDQCLLRDEETMSELNYVLGYGNPDKCKILVTTDRPNKQNAEAGSVVHENSYFLKIGAQLESYGVAPEEIYYMPMFSVYTGESSVMRSAMEMFWPFVTLKVRILRPAYAICFNKESAMHMVRKFSLKGTTMIPVNKFQRVEFRDCVLTSVYINHPFTIQNNESRMNEQQHILMKIGEVISSRKRARDDTTLTQNPFSMMMKRRKTDAVKNVVSKGVWALKDTLHVSEELEVSQIVSLMVSCSVRFFIGVNCNMPQGKVFKTHNAKCINVSYSSALYADRVWDVIRKIWDEVKAGNRIAVCDTTGYGGSLFFFALVYLMKNMDSSVETAAAFVKNVRGYFDPEYIPILEEAKLRIKNFI